MKRSTRSIMGFTLVELTVVLLIVSLLLGGMLLPLSAQQDIRLNAEAEKQLAEARDAVIGFAQINGHLPCPASTVTGSGKEDCAGPNYGFLPWTELGVSPADPWGRVIRYRVSPNFKTGAAPITTTTTAELKLQTRRSSGLADLTNNTPRDVAFVILSHGKNGHYGTYSDGTAGPPDPTTLNTDEDTNALALSSAGATIFVSRTPSPETTTNMGEFDDIVVWVSRSLLVNRLVAAGKM